MGILENPTLQNFDLLSVGIATAANGILGFITFFNNRKSITNRTFLLFSIFAILWSIFNYLVYQFRTHDSALWALRFSVFFAVWHSFFFFQLFYVFPRDRVSFPKWFWFGILPVVIVTAGLTLTPLVFSRILEFSLGGSGASRAENGPAIVVFALTVSTLIISGIVVLVRKLIRATGVEKARFKYVLAGTIIMFFLIIVFNMIFPAFLGNARFVPLGAVFTFPFIAFTAYAVIKHQFLSVKVITTEILTFVLAVVTLLEVLFAPTLATLLFRVAVFSLVLVFGILLIKSVRREVEQRMRLEKLTKELQAVNERLKELDELKSQFLSFASHQVKAPMTVVKGYASLIADGTYGAVSDKVKEVSGKIVQSANTMIALVNNLLDLRRLQEGQIEYEFTHTAIGPLVSGVVDELKQLAHEKNLTLTLSLNIGEARARIDVGKFRQVVQNLVHNSIKYTEEGTVAVEVDFGGKGKDKIVITVVDTGYGMSKELISELFTQFTRGKGKTKHIRGTGLGLFIAKQFIEAQKGTITASSPGEGKGSRFTVSVPVVG
jgi:signal transduction histidine kinase